MTGAPILDTYTIASDNINPFLGEAGDVITFTFVSDEALATIPVEPQVTFTIPEMKVTQTVTATMGVDNLHWSAQYTIPSPGANLNGKVTVSDTFWDVFNTVQEGIDEVASGGSVNVTTGVYNEDFTIATTFELLHYEAPPVKTYDVVKFKGVATLPAPFFPNADPNIENSSY